MSEYYLVDVKSIISKVPRSQFAVDEIEALAKSILAAGGLLSPILLKQTGAESYEVLAGDREYYAAVRAREINPREAEMVNAFVVPEGMSDAAVEQFERSRALHPSLPSVPISDTQTPTLAPPAYVDQRITNLESRLDAAIQDMKQTQQRDMQRLEQQLQALQQQIPQKVEPLEIFNTAAPETLMQKLAIAGIRGKTAETLIKNMEKARAKAPFTSFVDVVKRVEKLGEKRMLSILDAWNGVF
ncbi:ParB N-terminal domain-containing protein [Leptolyngbya sp. O-77]|uniref:ParB N-terminal domain-containing protein n=1 Tax=Leptolyngbya sp. O-77 TaxID=1080068 RepID=UPI00074D2E92|nr:ParB N-terminal domain-containing protein [Leptolyngbya sp. O-77]BAU44474.1 Nucleoid occlusion protein [Leptolyngbya sp. O-77]